MQIRTATSTPLYLILSSWRHRHGCTRPDELVIFHSDGCRTPFTSTGLRPTKAQPGGSADQEARARAALTATRSRSPGSALKVLGGSPRLSTASSTGQWHSGRCRAGGRRSPPRGSPGQRSRWRRRPEARASRWSCSARAASVRPRWCSDIARTSSSEHGFRFPWRFPLDLVGNQRNSTKLNFHFNPSAPASHPHDAPTPSAEVRTTSPRCRLRTWRSSSP